MRKEDMVLRKPYRDCKVKGYVNLEKFFSEKIVFSKKNDFNQIIETLNSKKLDVYRVWILFAGYDKNNWECLQVAHSKNNVEAEIKELVSFLFSEVKKTAENIVYTNSAFYEKVCPKLKNVDYRELLYSMIGNEYKYFSICLLDVDRYLGTKPDHIVNGTDEDRIIQICKNQYAEAKIAYETLALYWRNVSSAIDGQTIAYIVNHMEEF